MDQAASDALYHTGRRSWPTVRLQRDRFAAYCQERAASALTSERAADLYLACACGDGDPEAIAAFERRYRPEMTAALASMSLPAAMCEDVIQSVSEKLFCGNEQAPPAIRRFSGRGSLRSWTRAVVVRAAIDQLRAQGREPLPVDDQMVLLMAGRPDEVDETLLEQHRSEVEAAIRHAFLQLDARARRLLRQHHLQGMSIDELGAAHGVHRVTAFRWLVQARRAVFERARQQLAQSLGIDLAQAQEFISLLASQLDVTIERLLRSSAS